MMDENIFFASVIILTYNSSEYVAETLESILSQNFKDFEVILADDGSTDDTRTICEQFFAQHTSEFKRMTILPQEANMGTSANCNRAVKAASGKWIKLIAGDDILHPDCLQRLYDEAVISNKKVYTGQFIKFHTEGDKKLDIGIFPTSKETEFFDKSASEQHRQLLTNSFNMAPAVFLRRDVFTEIGMFDERFRLLEDLPYWIKLTGQGVKFYFIPHPVAYYRVNHESAVFAGEKFYNPRFMDGLFAFREAVIYKEVPKTNFIFYQAEMMERLNYWVITKIFGNKKNGLTKFISKAILFPTFKRFIKN